MNAFLSAFRAVKQALAVIWTWIFCGHSQPQLQAWHIGRLIIKKTLPFTCCFVASLPCWTGKKNFATASMPSGIHAQLMTWRKNQIRISVICRSHGGLLASERDGWKAPTDNNQNLWLSYFIIKTLINRYIMPLASDCYAEHWPWESQF